MPRMRIVGFVFLIAAIVLTIVTLRG